MLHRTLESTWGLDSTWYPKICSMTRGTLRTVPMTVTENHALIAKNNITFSLTKSAWKYRAKLSAIIFISKWVSNLVICMFADTRLLTVLEFLLWWESQSTHWNGILVMIISGKFSKITGKAFSETGEFYFWKFLKRNQVASFLGSVQGVSIEGFSTLEQSCLPNVEFISSKKEIFYDQELVSGFELLDLIPWSSNQNSFQNKESVVNLGQSELEEFNTIISAVKESCEHH